MFKLKNAEYAVIALVFILILVSCSYATLNYRAELIDGYQAMFHMLNGHFFYYYINSRELGHFIQFFSCMIPYLIKMNMGFKAVYQLLNLYITLNPILILFFTFVILIKKNIKHAVPFIFLNFVLSVYPTYSFHVSLVPESILFAWIAFIVWLYPPQKKSEYLYGFIGIGAVVLYSTGYDSILVVTAIFIIHFLYTIIYKEFQKKNIIEKAYQIIFLLVALFMLFYRLKNIVTIGVFFASIEYFSGNFSGPLWFTTSSIITMILIQFFYSNSSKKYLIIFINFFWGIYLFFHTFWMLGYWDGYHMRVFAICSSSFLMLLLMYQNHFNKKNDFSIYIVILSIVLINFLFDVKATSQWTKERIERKNQMLVGYESGCQAVKVNRWTISFESLIFQETFNPKFVVFQAPDKSYFYPYKIGVNPCERSQIKKQFAGVPLGLVNENIKTFNFVKIYN